MKKWLCVLLAAILLAGVGLPALGAEDTAAGEETPAAEQTASGNETVSGDETASGAETDGTAESETSPAAAREEASPEEYVGRAQAGETPYTDGIATGSHTHNARYARYDVLDGIDVSAYQGDIDWAKAAADGVDFAIIRVGGRFSLTGLFYDDSRFLQNIRGALANGIEVGVYFFSQAITEAEAAEEARRTLSLLGDYAGKLTLPVYLDVEYVNNGGRLHDAALTAAQQTDVAKAFCRTIEDAGLQAGVYSSFLSFGISASGLTGAGYSLWQAHWAASTSLSEWYDVWQYTASGTVSGISGKVDQNFLYRASCLTPFTDVELTGWYAGSVRYVLEHKLFYGKTGAIFGPSDPMTREMFVTVLYRLAGSPDAGAASAFTDVTDPASYYYNPVSWAAANGIVSGLPDGSFGVGRSMTRQEMATFMRRYAQWAGADTTARGTGTAGFADSAGVSSWAREAMDWAVENGILYGMSDTLLEPAGTSTRAQVATVLMRLAKLLNA